MEEYLKVNQELTRDLSENELKELLTFLEKHYEELVKTNSVIINEESSDDTI